MATASVTVSLIEERSSSWKPFEPLYERLIAGTREQPRDAFDQARVDVGYMSLAQVSQYFRSPHFSTILA